MQKQGKRPLRILAPTRYPWRFNGPRRSRHIIQKKPFVPLNKIDERIEGFTAFAPSLHRYDLIHGFNRIPLGRTPYLIGFESHLPRAFSLESTSYFKALCRSLAGNRCRGIVAISRFAEGTFRRMHAGSEFEHELLSKLEMRYPNLPIADLEDEPPSLSEPIHLVFVGHHFARKGGCVAVRLAEIARQAGIALRITIISRLEMGGDIWTDPSRSEYYSSWLDRLKDASITHYEQLPNSEVQKVLRQAHFCLLPTFGDTFGYSAIEAMANYCPMIATRQGALPEFIRDDENGILLDLPLDDDGQWIHIASPDRDTPGFERMFTEEIDRLAESALSGIMGYINDESRYRRLRQEARRTVQQLFSADDASEFWDRRYEEAVA